MARCSKCNGCTNMYNMYRPNWCEDKDCPEGSEEPNELKKEREQAVEQVLKRLNINPYYDG